MRILKENLKNNPNKIVNSKLQEIFKLPDRLIEQRRQLNKLGNKKGRLNLIILEEILTI